MALLIKLHNICCTQRLKFIVTLIIIISLTPLMGATKVQPLQLKQAYDNEPISSKTWEEIDIAWNNPFNPNKPNTAQLLRPIKYAHKYGLFVGKHIYMNLAEFGVPHTLITVIRIKPLTTWKVHRLLHGKQPVIGLYIHQTMDVRTYRFTDKRGHITTIHVTPNHPFYVKNLHAYLPINQITDTIPLEGKKHQRIYLVCPFHHFRHCGIPYQPSKLKTVYNLEVYRQHHFRVSNFQIKVHNSGAYTQRLVFQENQSSSLLESNMTLTRNKSSLSEAFEGAPLFTVEQLTQEAQEARIPVELYTQLKNLDIQARKSSNTIGNYAGLADDLVIERRLSLTHPVNQNLTEAIDTLLASRDWRSIQWVRHRNGGELTILRPKLRRRIAMRAHRQEEQLSNLNTTLRRFSREKSERNLYLAVQEIKATLARF